MPSKIVSTLSSYKDSGEEPASFLDVFKELSATTKLVGATIAAASLVGLWYQFHKARTQNPNSNRNATPSPNAMARNVSIASPPSLPSDPTRLPTTDAIDAMDTTTVAIPSPKRISSERKRGVKTSPRPPRITRTSSRPSWQTSWQTSQVSKVTPKTSRTPPHKSARKSPRTRTPQTQGLSQYEVLLTKQASLKTSRTPSRKSSLTSPRTPSRASKTPESKTKLFFKKRGEGLPKDSQGRSNYEVLLAKKMSPVKRKKKSQPSPQQTFVLGKSQSRVKNFGGKKK